MEEYANTLVIGCLIARCGPPGFKKLWRHATGFARHYLFNFDPTEAQTRAAVAHLKAYACEMEKLVIRKKVRGQSCHWQPMLCRRGAYIQYVNQV